MTTSISRANVSPSLPNETDTRSQANGLLIAAGVIAAAHLPVLFLHADQLWQKPHYQFFPLVLAGSIFLAWSRMQGMGPLKPVRPATCYPFVLLFLFMLGVSAVVSPWLGAVTSLLTALVAIAGVGGWPLTKRLLPAWILLWLAIPLPLGYDQAIINALQGFTARWSSVVLDMIGVQHVLNGNVVEIAEKRLLVEEACSGIHSLFASLACTMFFVMWARRPIFRSILLVLSAVYWVVICNVGRVVTVTIVEVYTDFNLTEGLPHEMLSLVIFGGILGLVFSTDRLLLFLSPGFLFSQRREEAGAEELDPANETRFPPVKETWLGATPVLVAYGVLAAVQMFTLWSSLSDNLQIARLGEETLPTSCAVVSGAATERTGHNFEARELDNYDQGDFSESWQYKVGKNNVNVSLDYPFVGWHELTVCYGANGWTKIEREAHGKELADGTVENGYVEATMEKQPRLFGYLVYGVFDPQGKALQPVEEEFWRKIYRSLGTFRKVINAVAGDSISVEKLPGPSYQVQVFVQSSKPLTDVEKKDVLTIFEEARSRISQKVAQSQTEGATTAETPVQNTGSQGAAVPQPATQENS